MSSDKHDKVFLESFLESNREQDAGNIMKSSAALLKCKGLLLAQMWEAKDADEYFDLDLLCQDVDEQLVMNSVNYRQLDSQILAGRSVEGPLFSETSHTPLSASQVLNGERVKDELTRDSGWFCQKPLQQQQLRKPNLSLSSSNSVAPPPHPHASPDTPPEYCKCGGTLKQLVTKKAGPNLGRPFLSCGLCGTFNRFADEKKTSSSVDNNNDDDDGGSIRPARSAFGDGRSRSGSIGRSKSYKRDIMYGVKNNSNSSNNNNNQSEEDDHHAAAQSNDPAPDFMSANKKLKTDFSAGGRKGGAGPPPPPPPAAQHQHQQQSSSDRGSRQFNPARSVLDAINKTDPEGNPSAAKRKKYAPPSRPSDDKKSEKKKEYDDPIYEDERLAQIDPKHVENILSEIMDSGSPVTWEDIAGLDFAKKTIKEIVVWPMLRPDIFKGLRGPPKGLLLFGPPGTGKTMIGKAIACEAKATFFAISASSLTSKWIGEGEKMVRALFAVARIKQPSVIFIDEIDSLLTQRSESEVEATRRIKTEFLVQLDGVANGGEERLLLVGATNRPQELDEAARRRLIKRLYIPLPEDAARRGLIKHLLRDQAFSLTESDLDRITTLSEGYSGADIKVLCAEASMGPIRELPDIMNADTSHVRPIQMQDFENALKTIKASVAPKEISAYLDWNKQFGTVSAQ